MYSFDPLEKLGVFGRRKIEVKCNTCGKKIIRSNKTKRVTCFQCRQLKNRATTKKYNDEKKNNI